MTETPLDPKREQMIAALYGELSPEEMQEFQALLKEDADLEREWDELQGTRAFLQKAGAEMEAQSAEQAEVFSFLMPGQPDSAARIPRPARWRRLLFSPATGFAAAALTLAVLLFTGLRIDRVEGGMTIRFAPGAGQAGLAATAPRQTTDGPYTAESSRAVRSPALSGGIPLDTASGPGASAGSHDGSFAGPHTGANGWGHDGTHDGSFAGTGSGATYPVTQAQADALGGYVTRADLAVFADQLMRMTEDRLRETRQVTRSEFVYLLNEFNQTLGEQRLREQVRYDSQLEDMWLGVVGMMAAGGNPAFQGQSANPQDVRVSPARQVAPDQEEGR